ncbi:UDP-2,3-diacylglucosamine diphosphatase [Conchiformibius kuhniae]|uniref:UDP-2,3-diacylglucosamine hydrolase n=1 Tax=Conchiformibius kuhniae TaxID=211502 RepID=A0A8T9MSX4_9NEIS|nr:UDP-2,3-diacylglucosamine diphosphatase [Conchiformibius kuhniae]UOP04707.1 UDP-2,3-diacylglucosamine diphosphatase [Conchiformibius kuhniae]
MPNGLENKMRQTVFVADVHLSAATGDLTELFCRSVERWRGRAEALYILGDLFDAWVGDDAADDTARTVARALRGFADTAPVYFVAGNRDFLLGRGFAAQAGMVLLPERSVVSLYGRRYLLMHGDELCSDDGAYRCFRALIRQTWLTALLLRLPVAWRWRVAARLREGSSKRQQRPEVYRRTDATETGMARAWAGFRAADALIHGHTHRPAVHRHCLNGRNIVRYVLPDWHGGRGGYLSVSPQGVQLRSLPEN